jgi:hypothetical protein
VGSAEVPAGQVPPAVRHPTRVQLLTATITNVYLPQLQKLPCASPFFIINSPFLISICRLLLPTAEVLLRVQLLSTLRPAARLKFQQSQVRNIRLPSQLQLLGMWYNFELC